MILVGGERSRRGVALVIHGRRPGIGLGAAALRLAPLPPGAVPGSAACAVVWSTSGIVGPHSIRVCFPPSRLVATLRCGGLSALTPAPRTLSGGTYPTMPNTTPPHTTGTAAMLDRATPTTRSVPVPRRQRAKDGPVGPSR